MGAQGAWSNQLLNLLIIAAQQAGFSGFFIYSPAPGTGNLIFSITGAAGTDPFGNAYPGPGLTVGKVSGTQIELTEVGGVGFLNFLLNNAMYGNGQMFSGTVGGVGGVAQVDLVGPVLLAVPDFAWLQFVSNSGLGGALAELLFNYTDANNVGHTFAELSGAGLDIFAGAITATQPGTGASALNPAVSETWHSASSLFVNNWGGSGSGVNGLFYRLKADSNEVEVIADIIQSPGSVTNTICVTLPAGYHPSSSINLPIGWNNPQANNSASAPWVNIDTSGDIQITGQEAAGKELFFRHAFPLGSL